MPESLSIDEALRRLEAALAKVEDALDHQVEQAARVSGLEGELHRLGTNRSRLAQSLDASEARAGRLEEASTEASQGLDRALETLRDVLARHGG